MPPRAIPMKRLLALALTAATLLMGTSATACEKHLNGHQNGSDGRQQAVGSVTTNPILMLVPWAVFAFAAGVKFLRLTSAWRQRGLNNKGTDHFRRSLERIWSQDQKPTR